MPDYRAACAYAAFQGWLIVEDDALTLTTAGLRAASQRWMRCRKGIVATRFPDYQPGRSNPSEEPCWRRPWDGLIGPLARPRRSWRAASTSAAPVLFAGMESTAGAFGYLPKRLQMRDCGLFGRPHSHDPRLSIWLDGLNPIGAAEWNDPVGLHEVDIATIPSGCNAYQRLDREESGGAG